MSRHRSRGKRRNINPTDINAPTRRESTASHNYQQGRTVRYKNRIRGPVSKITEYTTDELPEGSKLRQSE